MDRITRDGHKRGTVSLTKFRPVIDEDDAREAALLQDEGGPPLPALEDLHSFSMSANRDDKIGPMVSRIVWQALKVCAKSEHVGMNHLFCWAVARGLMRIHSLRDTRTILRVFEQLIDHGADVGLLDHWTYSPDREGMQRLSMHNIPPWLSGKCCSLAKHVGMSSSTVYGLAVRAGLAGLDLPGDDLSERLGEDVIEFRAALGKRAKHPLRVEASLRHARPKRTRYAWDE